MYIQHLNDGAFRLSTSGFVGVIDPQDPKSLKGGVNLVLFSSPQEKSAFSVPDGAVVVSNAGEMDAFGVTVAGIPSKQASGYKTLFWMEVEGVRILYVGGIAEWLVDATDLADLGDIDVVILPVGGGDVLNAETAAKTARLLEAKIVIPSHFSSGAEKDKRSSPEKFFKEMGVKVEGVDKLKLTKKDLGGESVRVEYLLPGGA